MGNESPITYFKKTYCQNCVEKSCIRKGAGIYKTVNEEMLPCILIITMLSNTDHYLVKLFQK